VPVFICPNCQTRSVDDDSRQGLSHQPVGCDHCGFGYVFQLLDDYFPRAGAGMATGDQAGRVLSASAGIFELSGRREPELLGRPVLEALHLSGFDGPDPVTTTLEWGVRQLARKATLTHAAGTEKPVIVDVFPALDDDGGLLVAVAPDPGI
jgi:hypothetical protein